MKKLLIIVCCVAALTYIWKFGIYMAGVSDRSAYDDAGGETVTLSEIFYGLVRSTNLVYNAYDGKGKTRANELLKEMRRCDYIPLDEADGRNILAKEKMNTFIVRLSDRFGKRYGEEEGFYVDELRCLSVDGKIYLVTVGYVRDESVSQRYGSRVPTDKWQQTVTVYECQGSAEDLNEILLYKQKIVDSDYRPFHVTVSSGFTSYMRSEFLDDFLKITTVAGLFLAFTAVPTLFVRRLKSDKARLDGTADAENGEAAGENAETEAAEIRVRDEDDEENSYDWERK